MKRISFDPEIAKKIQAGEIKGKILNNLNNEVRIVCFDREDAVAPIIALFKVDGGEGVMYVRSDGHAINCRDILTLEVPDNERQFKPFDRVLVRDDAIGEWCLAFYAYYVGELKLHRMVGGARWSQCIPYEGNENLLGTTDKPKEE